MKYFLSLLMLFSLATSIYANSPAVKDGGFEKGLYKGRPRAWGGRVILKNKKVSPLQGSIDKSDFKEGKQSFKLKLSGEEKTIIMETDLGKVQAGKVFEFSFWCKIKGKCSIWIRENHLTPEGKWRSKLFKNFLNVNGPAKWKKYTGKIKTYPGDAQLKITAFINKGPGEVWMDDFKIEEFKVQSGSEISFRMTPGYYINKNVFKLPQNSPLPIFLTCANKTQHKFKNPRLVFELPEKIKLLSCGYDARKLAEPEKIKKNGMNYVKYEYSMPLPKSIMRSPEYLKTAYNSVVPLVSSSALPSADKYKCYIYYKDDTLSCKASEFKVQVTPQIMAIAAPKKFSTGIHSGTSIEYYGSPLKKFINFYKNSGFNVLYMPDILRAGSLFPRRDNRDISPLYKAAYSAGIPAYMATNCMVNGYTLRYVSATYKSPDSVKIKRANGKIEKTAFDPAYMIRKGEWYVKGINQVIDQAIRFKAKGIWINWEPYSFIGAKGSFTELSLKDFAKFTGLSESKVLNTSPDKLVEQYRDKFYEFQSFQSGQAMKSMMELVEKRCKEKNHKLDVMLCTGPQLLTGVEELKRKGKWAKIQHYRRTFMAEDWLKHFTSVSSWYYMFFKSDDYLDKDNRKLIDAGCRLSESNATLSPVSHVKTLQEVETITSYIKEQSRRDNVAKTKYIHLSQNLQCGNWIVKPEEIRLQMLATFVGGADGVDLYYFPQGYDGSYWREAVKANSKIAMFEDFVMPGKKNDKVVSALPLTKLFNSKIADYNKRLAVRTFEKDGKLLIALCNFDYLDAAPVKLNISRPSGKYALSAPWLKRSFRTKKSALLSARELRNIELVIPAMTLRFILCSPTETNNNLEPVYLEDIKKNISILDAKFKLRLKNTGSMLNSINNKKKVVFNTKNFKAVDSKIFKTALKKEGESYVLKINAGNTKFNIVPEEGAVITQWIVDNKNQINEKLCLNRLYLPKLKDNNINGTFQLKSQKIKNKALVLVFEHRFSKKLKGIIMRKTFYFAPDGTSFKVNCDIINNSTDIQNIGFWYWNAFSAGMWKNNPLIHIGKKTFTDKKYAKSTTFYKTQKAPMVKNLLGSIDNEEVGDQKDIDLKSSVGNIILSSDSTDIAGFLNWAVNKKKFNTLELIFKSKVLKPNQTVSYPLIYKYIP
jgi:Carbohydrate binding domain